MRYNNILNFFLLFVAFCVQQNQSLDYCNANPESNQGFLKGKCVTFAECPPLFRLLRSSSITVTELRFLQKLTCRQDDENPTICCPISDISTRDLTNYNKGITPSPSRSTPDFLYPTTLKSTLPSENDKFWLPEKENGLVANGKHTNFELLPKLDECGSSSLENYISSDRIVGGTDAQHGMAPWMARIGYKSLETGEIEYYCGATIISKKYILTAAHCTREIDLSEYRPAVIRLGEFNADEDLDCSEKFNCSRALDFKIDKLIPHPRYSTEDKSNDIELIRIKGNIPFDTPFVKPICLPFEDEYAIKGMVKPESNQYVSRNGVVSGWGRTRWNKADGSSILQEVTLPIISNEECQANYSSKIRISELQMCAGGKKGEDSCGGDSGGPIIVPIPMRIIQTRNSGRPKLRPKYFQLGVVSFGPVQCGVGGLPGVYTRISSYKDWILDNLQP